MQSAHLKLSQLMPSNTALIVIDHGSRLEEANRVVERVAAGLRAKGGFLRVEPAHMELAEPTLAQAFEKCVAAGAASVVVLPYFLGPGSHASTDIPRLAAEAAASHPGVAWSVANPLGYDERIVDAALDRAQSAAGNQPSR